jgi:hypothetical protein
LIIKRLLPAKEVLAKMEQMKNDERSGTPLADFEEKHTLLWLKKIPYKKFAKQKNSSLVMNSIL